MSKARGGRGQEYILDCLQTLDGGSMDVSVYNVSVCVGDLPIIQSAP